ncbi:MAG: sulfatase-like hydrolase/transferase [Victivallaceae bacterium]|nr:sulfatase-like hydrolase/transferase [Victivallaceae bacterium]
MNQKNILFIISDQHRRDSSSCYGHDIVKTPAIDKLAATGIRFTNAYSQCPLCGPSMASVLTGTYPHTAENLTHSPEPYEKPLPDIPTLGSVFRDAGYATGLIGKVHIRGESATCDLGFDDRRLRFKTYELDDYIAAVGLDTVSKYIYSHGDLDQLYNLKTDPLEINNLTNQEKLAGIKNDLKEQFLLAWEMPTFNEAKKK